jgi:hypothetical protein
MEKQHLSVRDEIGFSSSLSHQDRVILHIFIDSFADLLHSSEGLEYVFFINTGIGSGCKIKDLPCSDRPAIRDITTLHPIEDLYKLNIDMQGPFWTDWGWRFSICIS